jgi:hypothetical protein
MKRSFIAFCLVSAFILGCSKQDENPAYGCKSIYSLSDGMRSTSKTLKGHILFSWKNSNNSWNYSIVPNLNVSPAHENVCEGNTITGEECLKDNLVRLPEGEEVYWYGSMNIETVEGSEVNLSFPGENTIRDIQTYCVAIDIELILENR